MSKNINIEIEERLLSLRDEEYAEFNGKIITNIDSGTMIGIRTPELRKYAKELKKREDIDSFLDTLPHRYFEENQLHAFIISEEKNFETCVAEVEKFLGYIDNWGTCDQLTPNAFKKYNRELLPYIMKWIKSDHTYTVRFAIKCLMSYFLEEDFDISYPELIAEIHSEEYYIRMMIAWYFATALAKQYEAIIPFIEEKRLAKWTHNKTIQKAVESYRITPNQKEYLRTLRIK
ncbi:MAG: DNA alkylation repair protein [Lachnospiraceae bacterium]|nr:DNA alkylation repair protein [Lachnospiraceae bacterium]